MSLISRHQLSHSGRGSISPNSSQKSILKMQKPDVMSHKLWRQLRRIQNYKMLVCVSQHFQICYVSQSITAEVAPRALAQCPPGTPRITLHMVAPSPVTPPASEALPQALMQVPPAPSHLPLHGRTFARNTPCVRGTAPGACASPPGTLASPSAGWHLHP